MLIKKSLRMASLFACGGLMLMWGSGSCVPTNFYADLLGNTIITGVTSAVLTGILATAGL